MRTVTLQSILDYVATKMLGAPALMGNEEAASFCQHINFWVREAWEREPWPEWTPIEERWYRDFWSAALTYAVGDEIFLESNETYYRCIVAATPGQSPLTTPASWEALRSNEDAPMNLFIPFEQTRKTAIGTVLRVSPADWRQVAGTPEIPFTITKDGIQIPRKDDNTSFFVQYRERVPEYTTVAWDPAATYAAGSLVYFNGNTYRAVAGITVLGFCTVTGGATLNSVNVNGTYTDSGNTFNGQPIYVRSGNAFKIYQATGEATGWTLTQFADLPGNDFWFGGTSVSNPDSDGNPYQASGGGASGTPTVDFTPATLRTPAAGEDPSEQPKGWELIPFPYVLAPAVKKLAYAEMLEDDGQHDKANSQFDAGEEKLGEEWMKTEAQQGQVRKINVLVR
jgi:hypothetical protein